jgi:hypothetical protein
MLLETRYAENIISLLEDAQDIGLPHVVLAFRPQEMELQPHHLSLFETLGEALDYLDGAAGNNYLPGDADYPVEYRHADQLLEELKQANLLTINQAAMNLGTIKEAVAHLKEKGYSDKAIEALQSHQGGRVERLEFADPVRMGDYVLNVDWAFRIDGLGEVTAPPLTVSLLHVPISHAVVQGIDTETLEKQMQVIDWSEMSLNDKDALKVIGLLNHLSRSGDPQAEHIADQLMLKYWSWALPGENDLSLEERKQEIMVSKTYDDLPRLAKAHKELTELANATKAKTINHQFIHPQNEKSMNLNNLDNLKTEMKQLGFSKDTIKAMEENMQKNLPEFTLHERINGNKGQVDIAIPFRQSSQSEYYYLNKYSVALNTGKPLEEGHKYMVITPDQQNPTKNLVRSFQQAGEAIAYFKEQKGNSELAAGRDAAHKTTLASKENGRDNFVAPDFQRTYRSAAITQTIYVEHGVGFPVQQAANLIQGRSVYRTDLLSPEKGPYQAWVKLNMDKPKDRFQNYSITNYHDPAYGFHLEQVLDKYQIKELNDPAKKETLIASLHNGDRPLITTVQNGQEVKLHLEAVPRYQQVSLYREDGKPEKREQFLKEPLQGMEVNKDQGKGKSKGKDNDQGMEV